MTDDSIRQRLYAEISKEDWFPPGLGVAVNQGVVTFQGIVSNQQARDALRVAARNTPGVKAVEDKLQFVDPSAAMMF